MDGAIPPRNTPPPDDSLGTSLTLLAVTLANAFAKELPKKEDIFILAALLSAVAANLYLIANSRPTFTVTATPASADTGEAEPGL
ncbi:MAG: hypothetical protein N2Z65_05305 [Clostridiales bacterium]|nr:hypothetical protein [Clostridiales bacterium]